MNEEKNTLIKDIKELVVSDENDSIEINPSLLEYFTQEELEEIRDTLVLKKNNFRKNNENYLEEIYNKTKKDEF